MIYIKKKILVLSIALSFTNIFGYGVFANNNELELSNYNKEIISNANLDKIENISKVEFYELLKENNFNLIEEKGYSKPSSKNTWNLTKENGHKNSGNYEIYVETTGSTIYSNYMFIGHDGKVKFNLNEKTGGKYKIVIYVDKFFSDTVQKHTYDGSSEQVLSITDLNEKDKLYFSVEPKSGTVTINGTLSKI